MRHVKSTAKTQFWNHHYTESLFSYTVNHFLKTILFLRGKEQMFIEENCILHDFLIYPWQYRPIQEVIDRIKMTMIICLVTGQQQNEIVLKMCLK